MLLLFPVCNYYLVCQESYLVSDYLGNSGMDSIIYMGKCTSPNNQFHNRLLKQSIITLLFMQLCTPLQIKT